MGTVALIRIESISLIVLPANYLYEFRHETRYTALENCRVTAYYVFVVDFGLIILMHHCNERAKYTYIHNNLCEFISY